MQKNISPYGHQSKANTSKAKYSVIIPCYNCSPFLADCLSSVFANTQAGYEVIFVDDGSTDNSLHLAKELFENEQKKGTLKILSKKNGGLSSARNFGIEHSAGDIIIFLDADDIISENFIEKMEHAFSCDSTDIVEFDFFRFTYLPHRKNHIRIHSGSTKTIQLARRNAFKNGNWFACARAYRKNLFNGTLFPSGMHFEDVMTVPFLYEKARNITRISEPLYGYRLNPKGITAQLKTKYCEDLEKFYKKLEDKKNTNMQILKMSVLRLSFEIATKLNSNSHISFASEKTREIPLLSPVKIGANEILFFYFSPKLYGDYIKTKSTLKKLLKNLTSSAT